MSQTIHIKVKFYGRLGRAFGRDVETLTLHGNITLKDAFQKLAEKYGEFRKFFVTDRGEVNPSLVIIVDGKPVDPKKDMSLELKDGSCIAAVVPVSGGW